jgi:hypothetical protein
MFRMDSTIQRTGDTVGWREESIEMRRGEGSIEMRRGDGSIEMRRGEDLCEN